MIKPKGPHPARGRAFGGMSTCNCDECRVAEQSRVKLKIYDARVARVLAMPRPKRLEFLARLTERALAHHPLPHPWSIEIVPLLRTDKLKEIDIDGAYKAQGKTSYGPHEIFCGAMVAYCAATHQIAAAMSHAVCASRAAADGAEPEWEAAERAEWSAQDADIDNLSAE